MREEEGDFPETRPLLQPAVIQPLSKGLETEKGLKAVVAPQAHVYGVPGFGVYGIPIATAHDAEVINGPCACKETLDIDWVQK